MQAGRRTTVALVEDDEDLRDAVVAFLAHTGFEIAGYETADDALLAVRARPVDVLVTDLSLGRGGSGLDLARQVREDERTRSTRILALSGAPTRAREHVFFDESVLKPIDLERLARLVADLAARPPR